MQILGISSAESSRSAATRPSVTPTRRRFALTGRSTAFDARVDAARGDLADIRLADRLFAPHYVAAAVRGATASTPVLDAHGAPLSELLHGETFEVLELAGERAWGSCTVDGSVGFVDAGVLGPAEQPRYVVCVPVAASDADVFLPMGSRLSGDVQGEAIVGREGHVALSDLCPMGAPVADFVALAEALVGTPYRAGGRSGAGLDAAGLVFLALSLGGVTAPRFCDLQAAALGHDVSETAPMLRGDLLFFDDHVAVVIDAGHVVHADPRQAAVVREPLSALTEGRAFGPLRVRRRLP